jgi:hypothetical protein
MHHGVSKQAVSGYYNNNNNNNNNNNKKSGGLNVTEELG